MSGSVKNGCPKRVLKCPPCYPPMRPCHTGNSKQDPIFFRNLDLTIANRVQAVQIGDLHRRLVVAVAAVTTKRSLTKHAIQMQTAAGKCALGRK